MRSIKADIRIGETVTLQGNGRSSITLVAKSGQRARFIIAREDGVSVSLPEEQQAKKPEPIRGLGSFAG